LILGEPESEPNLKSSPKSKPLYNFFSISEATSDEEVSVESEVGGLEENLKIID
jgi:hypothetical protein